jgi:hypothetical protein
MVRAIYVRDYKTSVYIEVIPVTEPVPSDLSFYDNILFARPDADEERAAIRRRTDNVDEFERYLEAPILHQATDILEWWRVDIG